MGVCRRVYGIVELSTNGDQLEAAMKKKLEKFGYGID